jgi:hypothetical protein
LLAEAALETGHEFEEPMDYVGPELVDDSDSDYEDEEEGVHRQRRLVRMELVLMRRVGMCS